jgi:hypothetical protein
MDSDEKRYAPGLDQATRAADTGAKAALAEGRTVSLERARDEALALADEFVRDAGGVGPRCSADEAP